ncbi:MAG: outer membrane protein assembly factor BamD [Dissulfurimicrobium sp.]|uniref:outer membrane protein assembly factor BamD n=1 Tax=Dissulfurimicrobium TaxID=1769732 RepID=UPI001EDBEFB3|nr:outer membrane protein assembly factor BamD [Dissulfurimicrobium hydrothermale]UKL13073.1 outer membrane protein assembly factor BamD [Dissulfurimicrobium hydrothermale]
MRKTTSLIRWISAAFLVVFFVSLVSGCGKNIFSRNVKKTGEEEMPFSSLYPTSKASRGNEKEMVMEAMYDYERGLYSTAAEQFQKIKDQFPFSPYATLAELHLADCKFYEGEYEEAVTLYEEFEKLHPNNEVVPYVIYQEGRCYHRLMSTADRDQTDTRKLIETYDRLLKRFPNSPYSFEAKRRIKEARQMLAEHELVVARWYIRTGQYPQARARLQNVLDLYPDTPASISAQKLLSKIAHSGTRADRVAGGREKRGWIYRLFPF